MTSRLLFSGLLVNAIVASSVAHQDDQPPSPMRVAVVSTTGPVAIRAGVDAMRRGGTAADAVLTTALAQIVLAGGSWISYAGRMTMVYYEAETGSVRLLPAQLLGDTLRIEVDISGTLPDGEGSVAVISRTEEWLSTSGATSSVALETGEPPKGFRFRVTPRF